MSASRRRRSPAWLGLFVLAGVAAPDVGVAAPSAATDKQVLVLYSTRPDSALSTIGERELSRVLDDGLNRQVDLYPEYIDTSRFPDADYQAALRDLLRLKCSGRQFDLVIALEDPSIDFIDGYQDELFPGLPVVYLALDPGPPRLSNATGVVADLDFSRTVRLAMTLQPETRRVVVVSRASVRDKFFLRMAREHLRPLEQTLDFTYLAGLPTADLEKRLTTLPPETIIFYLTVSQDGNGVHLRPLDYLDRVTAIANAPVYTWADVGMEHGVVGGSFIIIDRTIRLVGERALRVLRGERAGAIPTVVRTDLDRSEVDWRQIERWKIRPARIPTGTRVSFREPSAWDRYRGYIIATAVALGAQTLLIFGALVQAARRRRAEERVRAGTAELRRSYERIRNLGRRLIMAQELERARIARWLHDDLSQQVALLAIDLEMLEQNRPGQPAEGDGLARQIQGLVLGIGQSVRSLSHELHPAKLRMVGLVASLTGLAREKSRGGFEMTFAHENVPQLSDDLALCLYRIVQEAVHNAMTHGNAHRVSVQLTGDADGLRLTIVDDGCGFDVDAAWGKGLGLLSMTERLEPFGGTLTIRSEKNAGTRVEAIVPPSTLHVQAASAVASTAAVAVPHRSPADSA